MTQQVHKILEQALALPEEDRIAVANGLIESVEGGGDPEWERAWGDEIDRRLEAYRSGRDQAESWDDVRTRILKRLDQR